MTTTPTPIFPQTIQTELVQIVNATASSIVTLYTAGTNGSVINMINASNTDGSNAYTLTFYITKSSTSYILGTLSLPHTAGTGISSVALNVLTGLVSLPLDAFGNPVLYLGAGCTLQVSSGTTVLSTNILSLTAIGGDF